MTLETETPFKPTATTSKQGQVALPAGVALSVRQLYDALKTVRIQEVIEFKRQKDNDRRLVSAHEDMPTIEFLELLRQENILAAPVYRFIKEQNDPKIQKEYTGLVSVYDVLAQVVFQKVFDALDEEGAIRSESKFRDYMEIWKEEEAFMTMPIKELIGLSYESAHSWTLHSREHVSTLLHMMTTANYHRILVVDDEKRETLTSEQIESGADETVVLLTQTDLAKFVWDRRYKLGVQKVDIDNVFDLTCGHLEEMARRRHALDQPDPNQAIPSRPLLVKVPESCTALNAFRKLFIHRVSAVAVVNEKGSIIANLSASDLRGITRQTLESLMIPVFQFLELADQRPSNILAADQLRTCLVHQKMGNALEMMFTSRIHRVWLVNNQEEPVGVVTLSDILTALVPPSKLEL